MALARGPTSASAPTPVMVTLRRSSSDSGVRSNRRAAPARWRLSRPATTFPSAVGFSPAILAAVHAIFESDSEAVSALLADPELDRVPALPVLFDALARGLGLDLATRHALGRERRRAAEAWTRIDAEERKDSDALFRHHARSLRSALGAAPSANPLLADHEARVAAVASSLTETDRARLLPTLLHLSAVRLIGPDPEAERLGYTFWERTLEGLRRSR